MFDYHDMVTVDILRQWFENSKIMSVSQDVETVTLEKLPKNIYIKTKTDNAEYTVKLMQITSHFYYNLIIHEPRGEVISFFGAMNEEVKNNMLKIIEYFEIRPFEMDPQYRYGFLGFEKLKTIKLFNNEYKQFVITYLISDHQTLFDYLTNNIPYIRFDLSIPGHTSLEQSNGGFKFCCPEYLRKNINYHLFVDDDKKSTIVVYNKLNNDEKRVYKIPAIVIVDDTFGHGFKLYANLVEYLYSINGKG